MTIDDMHYDFKKKLNKLDSQKYRGLLIPEIDWTLNEAKDLYVKMIAKPRVKNHLGFEIGQRSIDDIRNIVVEESPIPVVLGVALIPDDYLFYITSYCMITKEGCSNIKSHKTFIRQHDDDFENSEFDKSSFEWRTVNGVFNKDGVKLFSDDFQVNELRMTYIKQMKYIHNAQKFRNGQYVLPSGTLLSGSQDCELPEHTHREIVDIAVLLATGEIQSPDYQIKMNKLMLNQIT